MNDKLINSIISEEYESLDGLYRYFHANPELSFGEKETARRLAAELSGAGFEVTTNVGGHGVVGVLQNGLGRTVLVRTDMDALPVEEQSGLPYQSRTCQKTRQGSVVPAMHACGHDLHMASFVGTARVLSRIRDQWQGTVVMIGQPAEEMAAGARALISDGLYERFPRPDWCLALHVSPAIPIGTIGYCEGYAWANVDVIDITVRGVGGHGATPHRTKDPVVTAAQLIIALQTVISREIDPLEPSVLSVCSVHGGTASNIIPNEVGLQLTLRSYSSRVRACMIDAVERIALGIATAAGIPSDLLPIVKVLAPAQPAVYNDPVLTRKLARAFESFFGGARVMAVKPEMVGEDFGCFGEVDPPIPVCIFRVGTAETSSRNSTAPLHSSRFAPPAGPVITTGAAAMATAVIDLLCRESCGEGVRLA